MGGLGRYILRLEELMGMNVEGFGYLVAWVDTRLGQVVVLRGGR